MPTNYPRTDPLAEETVVQERKEKQRKALARKERQMQRAQQDAEGLERLWRRLSVLAVLASLTFIGLIVATSIWCYLGRYFHDSRGGGTAWLTILWVILLAAAIFGAAMSLDQWSSAWKARRVATRAYQDFLEDGEEYFPDDESLKAAIERVLQSYAVRAM